MIKRLRTTLVICAILATKVYAQESDSSKVKTNWNMGALPVVSYNSDLGLQYGILSNIYYYGNGDIYPEYYHSIYGEVSRFTKGSGIYRLFYDSKHLIPNIRTTFDISYLPDETLDFTGFNGYQAVYNQNWKDDTQEDYVTRMFYKHKRNVFITKADFQGKTSIPNVNWTAGITLQNIVVDAVDIDKLNKGKSESEALPDTLTLYSLYRDWGIIEDKEANGGFFTTLKAGLVYDTRNNEALPTKGIWSEVVLAQTINPDFNFTKIGVMHRQYFSLVPERLSFAYRVGYQGVIAGDVPFYALPTMIYSFNPSSNNDGLGGSRTVRGIIRNRVVGQGVTLANIELRWQFVHFDAFKQNFYLALSPFMDYGQVVVDYKFSKDGIPTDIDQSQYFKEGKDSPHLTYGAGFRIAMNHNFIVACDVGLPLNEQDGNMGIYVGLNWLF